MNRVRSMVQARASVQRRTSAPVVAPAAVSVQRRIGNAAATVLPTVSQLAPAGAPQMRLAISSPADAAEREAESVGKQIARMPAPQVTPAAPAVANTAGGLARRIAANAPATLARRPLVRESGGAAGAVAVQRLTLVANHAPRLQRHTRADGSPAQASSAVSQEIVAEQSGGEALPGKVRQFMEPRFGADFGNVKIHTDARAARLAQSVQAQAFTVGGHIFFGAGQFNPDSDEGKQLIAHELTHTIQQGAARQSPASAAPARSGASERPATSSASVAPVPASMSASMPASRPAAAPPARAIARAPATLARSPAVRVNAAQSIQRWGLPSMQDVRDFFADKARYIPGYTLLTVIMGWNPISGRSVARSGVNILRALVECIPAGPLLVQVLEANGMMQRGGVVAEREFGKLTGAVSDLTNAFGRFIDSLNLLDLGSPSGVWERAKAIFTGPIDRLISAGTALVGVVLELVKQAVLQPLARLAQPTRAWDLLCAVLGKNPITGEPVPRNPQTLIGGFMKLIGQEEVWANIQRANAIPRAWAWFQAAMSGLIGLVSSLPQRFITVLKSLTLADLLTVVGAFAKVVGMFAGFVVDFLSWAGNAVWELLKIIFEVVAPGAMPYLKKVGASLRQIFKNPLPFVGNLARAGKLGFNQFKNRFGTHLKNGIIQWLTGSLPGIYIPAALNLQEIVKFVLSVLGISWAAFRVKLVRAIGEPAVVALETGFEIVKILVTQGPAAAWDKIKEHLSNLKDMAMNAIKDFIVTNVVTRATAKIASLLIPGAGFISAIVSIWDMIQVFISQMQRIAQVGKAFLDSVMDIANGALGNAANKVESVLANLLTMAINFLAGFVGLGGVAGKVMNVINTKIRPPIDKAMDKLVEWIVKAGRALLPGGRADEMTPEQKLQRVKSAVAAGVVAVNRLGTRPVGQAVLRPILAAIRIRYGLKTLEPVTRNGRWTIRGELNPSFEDQTNAASAEASAEYQAQPVAAGASPVEITKGWIKHVTDKLRTLKVKFRDDQANGLASTADEQKIKADPNFPYQGWGPIGPATAGGTYDIGGKLNYSPVYLNFTKGQLGVTMFKYYGRVGRSETGAPDFMLAQDASNKAIIAQKKKANQPLTPDETIIDGLGESKLRITDAAKYTAAMAGDYASIESTNPMHSIVSGALQSFVQGSPDRIEQDGLPAAHAEVRAVNWILNNANHEGINKIYVATYNNSSGAPFFRCKNCTGVINAIAKEIGPGKTVITTDRSLTVI